MGYLWFPLGHFPATSWDCEDRHDCLRTQKTFLWEMTQSIPQLSVAFRCFLDRPSLDPGSRRRNLLLRCLQCGAMVFFMTLQGCYMILRWFEEDQHNWHIFQHEILDTQLALLVLSWQRLFKPHLFTWHWHVLYRTTWGNIYNPVLIWMDDWLTLGAKTWRWERTFCHE